MLEKLKFVGHWPDRLDHLFDMGVAFEGRSVLDIGCNVGVVGYEVCKQNPSLYDGTEVLTPQAMIAEVLFRAVEAPSRILRFDIADPARRAQYLRPRYDVVLYLAVHQHVQAQSGREAAQALAYDLCARCSETLVFRGPHHAVMRSIAEMHGLDMIAFHEARNLNPICAFARRT